MRRVLLVSFFAAPAPGGGGTRWDALARHLRPLGWETTVLTTDAFGSVPGERDVVRTGDLTSSAALRRVLRRPDAPAEGGTKAAPGLLTRVVVPDAHLVSWLPGAVRAARALVRAGGIDAVVTSGPPDSTHLLGLALGRSRPAWVADFRDGWSFEPLRTPFATAPQRRLDAALEARVAREADAVAGATRPIAEDLATRLDARARWVTNGFEAPGHASIEAVRAPASPPRRLVYTGTLSGSWGRDPSALLDALAQVPEAELVLAGRLSPEDEAALAAQPAARVTRAGVLSRDDALALQRSADALVLLTSRNRGEASGKLFEYLAAGRPVLAVAAGSEAGRIVSETGSGAVVDQDDAAAIAAALRAPLPFAPEGLEPFTQPAPARAMAALLDEALAHRAGAR